jgi:hypothetical protein
MSYNKGFKYGMKNCLYEAVLEKILTNCTCKPVFVNFKLDVSCGIIVFGLITSDKLNLQVQGLSYCRGRKLGCTQYWMNHFGNEANPRLTDALNKQNLNRTCKEEGVLKIIF